VRTGRRDGAVPGATAADYAAQTWEVEHLDATVRCTWSLEELDTAAGRANHRSRIEVVDGAHRGTAATDEHPMRAWTWATWREAVAASPLMQVAAYDGDADGWPEVALDDLGAGGHLVWHELRRR
jgi:hypothetical protein